MKARAVLLCAALLAPALAQETKEDAAPGAEPRAAFIRPRVHDPVFRHDDTALMEIECERVASFVARHAARTCTAKILAGEAAAQAEGRRLLTLALHLHPQNPSAVHCGLAWSGGKSPGLPAEPENLSVFSRFLVSLAARQTPRASIRARHALLGRFLIRLAADSDPANEDAVYLSERRDRTGEAPPWQDLVDGKLAK